jgi:RNA polymerase sigma factor (sigma-70 family)
VNSLTDQQLLRGYAGRRSEAAFAEIVRRHVDLVYSAAWRMVGDAHLAEDVTQGAFIALAQNARQLADRPVLSGWLHRTAQNLAANTVRADVRRRAREQEAAAMNQWSVNESDAAWESIAPQLDAALGELNEAERDAVLLRYFERKSACEMAQILGTSEDAAQKRVSRAVERLREFFSKRNVTIGAGGLAVLISANAVQSAPVGLAATISAAAVLTGTAVSTSTAIATTKIIAMTALQKTIIGTALVAAVGTGVFEAHQAVRLREQNQTLRQQQTSLAEKIRQLQRQRGEATNQVAGLLAENAQLQSGQKEAELLKLRGAVGQLQSEANDPSSVAARGWLDRANQLKQWADQNPAATIPEFQFLTTQDWLNAAQKPLNTEVDYRRAMSSLRDAAGSKFENMLKQALNKYSQANNGQFPTALAQLEPFFDSPVGEDILQRWEIVSPQAVPGFGVPPGPNIITEKTAVDDFLDSRIFIAPDGGYTVGDWLSGELADTLVPVYRAFEKANPHADGFGQFNNINPSRYLPYATTPAQQAAVQKLIEQQQLKSAP